MGLYAAAGGLGSEFPWHGEGSESGTAWLIRVGELQAEFGSWTARFLHERGLWEWASSVTVSEIERCLWGQIEYFGSAAVEAAPG